MLLLLVSEIAMRRERAELGDEGVRVHNGLWWRKLVPWNDVAEVSPPSRWHPRATLETSKSRTITVGNLSADAATRLATWLTTRSEPAPAQPPTGQRPAGPA